MRRASLMLAGSARLFNYENPNPSIHSRKPGIIALAGTHLPPMPENMQKP